MPSSQSYPKLKRSKSNISTHSNTSNWISLLLFLLTFIFLSSISTYLRYQLPTPKGFPKSVIPSATNAQVTEIERISDEEFSELLANEYIDYFANTIGYRIVGTEEMSESIDYLVNILHDLKNKAELAGSTKNFEILTQQDDGAHLFEFIGKHVWKKYFQLSNVIVKISDPAIPSSNENAILINAHLDSTLPSPGAADDVAGVAVMLEAIRIISQSPDWKMHNGVVFLFNGAEESLQDASHMFITKHPLKDIVRAVINLEACGTAGQEILFQATSAEMIEAYSKVPRPFGSIIATEVFQTGLIASDTDFRQFVQYGNLTGLDMAIMQNSYLYHTTQDIPSKIQPGVIQHMGENTMALIKHLTSSSADLTNIKPASTTVFFSGLGGFIFIMYSKPTALRIYTGLFIIALTVASRNIKSQHSPIYFLAFLAVIGSLLGFIINANLVAFFTSIILDKALSWYRHECFPLLLFGPPSLLGGLLVQFFFSKLVKKFKLLRDDEQHILSHATLCALMTFNGVMSVIGAYLNIGASYLPAIGLVAILSSLIINDFILAPVTGKRGHIHLPTYLVALIAPVLLGVEGLLAFLDLFVPMTGRMGHDVHVDFIIASLVSAVGFNVISISLPLSHRFSLRAFGRFLVVMLMVSSLVGFIFTRSDWKIFDEDHPKRLAVLHMENLTSSSPTFDLHIASMDRAPGFESLVKGLVDSLALSDQSPVLSSINDDIPDWDIIYPVSQFLKSCQVPLSLIEHQLLGTGQNGIEKTIYKSPWTGIFNVICLSSKLDFINQRRTISIAIDHPGLIWTVIAFTADVVEWDLPSPPLRGKRRHHVKEASGFGIDRWTLNLTIALTETEFESAMRNEQISKGQRPPISKGDQEGQRFSKLGKLQIEFSGIDQLGLYPARSKPKPTTFNNNNNLSKKNTSFNIKPKPNQSNLHLGWIGNGNGGPGLQLFGKLFNHLPKWIDPFLLSAISNSAFI